ncbi:MAG: sulfatase, partial [Pirellulales bacterium]|nr:sulfatase [Pirellulales bacterium]
AILATLWLAISAHAATVNDVPPQPNFVIIFCDDLGWGDLSCFGHPTIATPELDRMAAEGTRMTQFYVAASVCTPSRAALMTGRYPARIGMCGKRRVLFPNSIGGIQPGEVTIAETLKSAGYQTAMVGKWHLGHLPEYLPTRHGFDRYYGIPYSNDMDNVAPKSLRGRAVFQNPDWRHFNVPLLEGTSADGVDQIERPTDQRTITRRYTVKAVEFIREQKDQPFFLYLAHSLPHVPLFRSDSFAGHSRAGLYGDVIEEIDWSVGQVLQTLRDQGIAEKTMVVFTSDNGPWLTFGDHGGSAGPLRNGKGTTFEGGMRVPGLFWMPQTIPAGVTNASLCSTLDLLPTFAAMAGASLPENRVLDGFDLTGMLVEQRPSPRKSMFYYRDYRLMAVRHGRYKAHYITQDSYVPGSKQATTHDVPLLYDLEVDLGEARNLAAKRPAVLAEIAKVKADHEASMKFTASQLDRQPQ